MFDQTKDLTRTKRNILEVLASFFRHLELIVLDYKLLFQKLCKITLNRDTEIPSDLLKEWHDGWLKTFCNLNSFEVNRNVFVNAENHPIAK